MTSLLFTINAFWNSTDQKPLANLHCVRANGVIGHLGIICVCARSSWGVSGTCLMRRTCGELNYKNAHHLWQTKGGNGKQFSPFSPLQSLFNTPIIGLKTLQHLLQYFTLLSHKINKTLTISLFTIPLKFPEFWDLQTWLNIQRWNSTIAWISSCA